MTDIGPNDIKFLRTLSERAEGYRDTQAILMFRRHVTPERMLALLKRLEDDNK